MFLARMITRPKWQPKRGLASDEIPADAITADLRTSNNALSFWQCGEATDSEILNAVLAIAAGRDRLQKLDIVWIPRDELVKRGHQMRSTLGRTPVRALVQRHVDVCHLDYGRLGQIGDQVAVAIRRDRFRRFPQRAIRGLLIEAVQNGSVSQEDLAETLRTEIRAAL